MDELIARGDLDELLRRVDQLAGARDWPQLLLLAERCRLAHERGRQLWPASEHALYRVALDGPAALACRAVSESDGRFSLGPLSEVIASTHTWRNLEANLDPGPLAATIAHECAIRGEDLSSARTMGEFVDLPLVIQPWEPEYPVATYTEYALDAGESPTTGALQPIASRPVVALDDDRTVTDALVELVRTWTSQSNGRARAVGVEGDAFDAITALGPRRARAVEIAPAEALATMAWCAASGGARGRRRGMAAGRFDAWWAAAALTDLDWPPDPDELGGAIASLRWWRWDAYEPAGGWVLQLAIGDPEHRLAWAVDAHDAV
jgi:hypothetical protein